MKRGLFVVMLSAGLGSALLAPEPAFSQAKKRACPAGQRPSLSGCVDASPRVRQRATGEAKPRAAAPIRVPRPDPALAAAYAPPSPGERASRALLLQELARLEAMLERTSPDSPDHLSIVRRLAEGYVELEMIAERERAKAQAAADAAEREAKRSEPPKRPRRGSGTVL